MKFNPYTILELDQSASKKEIVQGKAVAMQKKTFPLNEIAQAEKILLDPQKRVLADFLLPILTVPKRYKRILDIREDEVSSEDLEQQDIQLLPQSVLSEISDEYCSSEYIGSLVIEKIKESKINTDVKKEEEWLPGCFVLLAILALSIFGLSVLFQGKQSPKEPSNNNETSETVVPSPTEKRSSEGGAGSVVTSSSYQHPSDSSLDNQSLTLKDACGSPRSSSSQIWWSIRGPRAALTFVKTNFCADAFIIGNEVQVASFDNEYDAQEFLQRLNSASTLYSFTLEKPHKIQTRSSEHRASTMQRDNNQTAPHLSLRPSCGSTGSVEGKTWWPVKGPREALDIVKTSFCADALIIKNTVQVASFDNKKEALEFADTLNQKLPYIFWVGQPTER